MAIAETAARKLLHGGGGAAVARGVAAGTLSFGLDGLWQLIAGFFADIFAYLFGALAGAAHLLVLPLEALWHLLVAAVAGAANAISSGLGGLWHLVAGFFPHLFAAVAGAAHDLTLKLDAFWRWLQAAATVALPFVLGVAAVLLVVALILFYGPAICAITVGVCKAIVVAVCYFGHGLFFVGAAAARALSCLLPPCAQCMQCCAVVTMKAPSAAGMFISRAAFEAAPALYFQILRAGGAVVAAAVFCASPVAWAIAAPVAFLFRTSVGA